MPVKLPTVAATLAVLLFGAPSVGRADSIVVPLGYESADAPIANGAPFSATPTNPGTFPSQRYQQVYDSSTFGPPPAGMLITEIAFRRDATSTSPPSATILSVDISLSTTSAPVDGLSTAFADNVGADDQVVFSGSLTFTGPTVLPAQGYHDWDFVIPLAVPFLYQPGGGNLLMDVRNFTLSTGTILLDAVDAADSVSRVFTASGQTVNSPTGIIDTRGLVTRLTFTPVPEPGASSLLCAAVGAWAVTARRRQRPA